MRVSDSTSKNQDPFVTGSPPGQSTSLATNGIVSAETPRVPFELVGLSHEKLIAPLRFSFSADTAWGPEPKTLVPGTFEVERDTGGSVTLLRKDILQSSDGQDVVAFITRVSLFRGSLLIKMSHTLEVIAGTHANPRWIMTLPLKPADDRWEERQLTEKKLIRNGKKTSGSTLGAYAESDLTLAITDFPKLFPNGMVRDKAGLHLLLCAPSPEDHLVLQPGVARTHQIWLWLGEKAPTAKQAAAQANAPLHPFTPPNWAVESGAWGLVAKPQADPRFDKLLLRSIEDSFSRIRSRPHEQGFLHWGDVFGRDSTFSYYGHHNQEYDPGAVIQTAFLRSGDAKLLHRALPFARHYADVDISHDGGVFQHRATRRQVEIWIARTFAQSFRKSVERSNQWDGSPTSLLRILKRKSAGLAKDLGPIVETLAESGASDKALVDQAFLILGQLVIDNLVLKAGKNLRGEDEMGPKQFASAIAKEQLARDYGFKDAEQSFKPFFRLFGGSWEDFPSFHIDPSPNPLQRHSGGHSLVESVVTAYWLTGDLRFREVALRVARHHALVLAPREVNILEKTIQGKPTIRGRNVGWPLLNLVRLIELLEGDPDLEELQSQALDAAQACADVLAAAPHERWEGTIHVGVCLEALTNWHMLTGDEKALDTLVDLGRKWAAQHFDKRGKAFRYKPRADSDSGRGYSGLMLYGLAYGNSLRPHPATAKTIKLAWNGLQKSQGRMKPMAMTFRSAARALAILP